MSSKTALERENKSLRDKLNRERRAHADMLKAKNDALRIAQAQNPIHELDRSFPHLHGLLAQLTRAHEAAMAIKGSVIDVAGNNHPTPADTPSPLESGASTNGDRSRVETIDHRLEKTAEWVSDLLGDRGPVEERAPQCGNPDCPAHAVFQPFTAVICGSCQEPFGKYHPKLSPVRRRCKIRTCPAHDRVGECEHSLLGSSRSTPT